jgi:hypothetical protein
MAKARLPRHDGAVPPTADIVLTTLNATWAHAAFGLRCLLANMGELASRTALREFTINQRVTDIAESLLRLNPKILGLGVYIWNAVPCAELAAILKRLRPQMTLIIGGPEVSHEWQEQEIVRTADYLITGEADIAFAGLCRRILSGNAPGEKILHAPLPQFAALELPYHLYDAEDCARRVVYVEASRGCPFRCEFCLSSLDVPVRPAPLDRLLPALESLIQRGVRQFKFVDRTFNLNIATGRRLLEFFLERWRPGMFVHFEMIPDRLPVELRDVIRKFPPGALQFEIGIQTFHPLAAQNISRRNDRRRTEENLRFLRSETGVHVHADLIAGLPGEDMESFGRGFDDLLALGPQEIQVGILKRLRGTPISRHDLTWGMVYSPHPPYEVLETNCITFADMQRLRRFSRYWDLIGNSGQFSTSLALLWPAQASPFASFLRFSDWLWEMSGQTHGLALLRLVELLFQWCSEHLGHDPQTAARMLWADYVRPGRREQPPALLAPFLESVSGRTEPPRERGHHSNAPLPVRQRRHWTAGKSDGQGAGAVT